MNHLDFGTEIYAEPIVEEMLPNREAITRGSTAGSFTDIVFGIP
jgi:hypothetical protein